MAGAASPISRRAARLLDAAPWLLVLVAEAAWVSVVAGLVAEYAHSQASIGLPNVLAFVVVGAVVARVIGPRLGARWPRAAVGLVAGAATIGWLASDEVRAAMRLGDLAGAVGLHPGGWLAGLAFLRGIAHAALEPDEGTVDRLNGVGLPGLAVMAALGGLVADPWRSTFLTETLRASIVFVASATLGLAFVRLAAAGDATVDWRRNPMWVALLGVLVAASIWLAFPASLMTGTVLGWLVGVAVAPIVILGILATFHARNRWLIILALAAGTLIVVLGQLANPGPPQSVTGSGGGGRGGGESAEVVSPLLSLGFGGLGVLLVAIAVFILARIWMRRLELPDSGAAETRSIDLGPPVLPTAGRRRAGRRSAPTDAIGAYVRLLDDIRSQPLARREAWETPAEHAGRLRRQRLVGLPMQLLAADYALARFAGRALTPAEDRRAIGRWRQLRSQLIGDRRGGWRRDIEEIIGNEEIEKRY